MEISQLRKKIDGLDRQLLNLLNQRMELSMEIGKNKLKNNQLPYAPGREAQVLSALLKNNRGPLAGEDIKGIYQKILQTGRSLARKLKVAYFGPPATFTHLAAQENFGNRADYVPVKSIKDVFVEVEKKRADYGVVPVENSTEGAVNYTLDMFLDSDLKIVSEIYLKVVYHLLVKKGGLSQIKTVYSHPQSLAQCRNWLEEFLPGRELVEVSSTARAAQLAAKNKNSAAVASELASKLYGLKICVSRIEDQANNFTRFLVVGQNFSRPCGQDKTSILFSVKDRVGALHDMLVPFKKYGLNLTKIESRPSRKKAWEYVFFVDFLGHLEDKNVKLALKKLENLCVLLKVLGSYPQGE